MMIENKGKKENDDSQSLRKKIYHWEKKNTRALLQRDTILSNIQSVSQSEKKLSAKGSFIQKRLIANSRSQSPRSTSKGEIYIKADGKPAISKKENSFGSLGDLKDEIEMEDKKRN